jgi:hypothetical protein
MERMGIFECCYRKCGDFVNVLLKSICGHVWTGGFLGVKLRYSD